MIIKTKRIYEKVSKEDGYRILIDRLWPRGIKKEEAKIDNWIKEIAPSNELRKWFAHDPAKWKMFKRKYISELNGKEYLCKEIINYSDIITLIYSAKDKSFNNAVVLKEHLENNSLNFKNR